MVPRALQDYRSEFESHWRKARKGRAQSVHGLRITARRMVAVLEIMSAAAPGASVDRLRRRMRKLIRRLGGLRDLQVQRSLVEESTSAAANLKLFARHLKDRESVEMSRVHDGLDRAARRKILREWDEVEKSLEFGSSSLPESRLADAVHQTMRKRSNRLRLALRRLNLADSKTIHAVRIALKKLRYVLESGSAAFGVPARAQTERFQECQKVLGKVRDLDLLGKEFGRWSAGRSQRGPLPIGPSSVRLKSQMKSRLIALADEFQPKKKVARAGHL